MTDAEWCGRLSQTLREISRIAATRPEEIKRMTDEILDRYDREWPTDTSDPKHPDFHSVHADLWDAREGK